MLYLLLLMKILIYTNISFPNHIKQFELSDFEPFSFLEKIMCAFPSSVTVFKYSL